MAYEAPALRGLAARFAALEPADQVLLLSDSFALAQAGQLPMASWLDLLAALPGVQGPARATLFTMAGAALDRLDQAVVGTPAQPPLRAAGRALFAPELARIGWAARPQQEPQQEPQLDKLRGTLIARLAQWDDADTIAQALQRFAQDEAGQEPLAPSIRAAVIEAAGTHADRARFDQLLLRLKNATSEEDRWLYASALASGRDAGRARELLAASLAGIAPPNIAAAIPGMVGERTPLGAVAYDFTLANWGRLAELAGGNWGGAAWLLPNAASRFTDRARAARLVADQQRKAGRDGAVPAARIGAAIELLAAVREREARSLGKALAAWRPGS